MPAHSDSGAQDREGATEVGFVQPPRGDLPTPDEVRGILSPKNPNWNGARDRRLDIPARQVQQGDTIGGIPVTAVETWMKNPEGSSVWISMDNGQSFGAKDDDLVEVVRRVRD